MRHAGRSRRAVLVGAGLLAAQLASTLVLGTTRAGVCVTNLLLLAAAVATASAASGAARRAAGLARRHWTLVSASLSLWAVGQGFYSYEEIWVGVPATYPSTAHLLFRLAGAPLVMALLLRDEEVPGLDWQRVLDFAQVGILFLFFFFDFYFLPGGSSGRLVDINLLGFMDLSSFEDWLLAAGFVLRATLSGAWTPRHLAARWAPFLVLYAVTSAFYDYSYSFLSPSTGSWHDLPWVVTFATGFWLAAAWEPPVRAAQTAERSAPTPRDAGVFTSDWLPGLIPLLTLALALRVASQDMVAASAVMFGSVACFGARLVATQSRQERAMAALRASEARARDLVSDLEAKNAELERFTYTVSHDLRSPLITILGFLGFVERSVAAGASQAALADVGRIRSAATHMERLLRELLEMSRIGRVVEPAHAVSFGTLACEAVATAAAAIAAARADVQVEPDLPIVHGDPVRLRQVVQNLLDNAVKFSAGQPEPRVTIGAAGIDSRGQHVLFVRDNGVGIAARHHERVFGLFEKLDARGEGTGVGLAIVRRVVELHGGRSWVESAPGQGATFYFTLPAPPFAV